MFKKRKTFIIIATLFVVMLAACAGDSDVGGDGDGGSGDTTASDRDTLIVGVSGNIVSLDLHGTNDNPSSQVVSHIFETLVNQDENMELYPGLATEWRQIDDRVWEFDLREGVYFHNGEPLTAYDVYFTMHRAALSTHVDPILGILDPSTIEVIDEHTVRIGTEEPFAPFLAHLAHSAAGIKNELAVDYYGDDVDQNPVGTGPYELYEWVVGDRVVIERFENYHGDEPNIREIIFRVIEDGQARYMALESGDADIILNPLPVDLDRLGADENLVLLEVQGLSTDYMGMNSNHPQLAIPEVRQAINYAINTEEMVLAVNEGHAYVASTFISPAVFGYSPYVEAYEYNVERALELMAEAGYADGFDVNILTNSESAVRNAYAEVIANQLQAIGINAEIRQLEWASFLSELDAGEAEIFFLGWVAVTGDADYALHPLFHTSSHGVGGNQTFFSNERVDYLLDYARTTVDEEARVAAYHEVQEIVREYAPWVVLHQANLFVGTRENVRGVIMMPNQVHFFGNVYFAN